MQASFSAAADRNKEAIGDALREYLLNTDNVIEIGSGTGQHAVYLAERYTGLHWQPTDRAENLSSIEQWVDQSGLDNIAPPIELDVSKEYDNDQKYNLAYSANTAHIMSEPQVAQMFKVVSHHLNVGGYFVLYGPFLYATKATAPGNKNFDAMLRQQSAHMGLRHKARLDEMAFDVGMEFKEDIEMPTNNRILVWQK